MRKRKRYLSGKILENRFNRNCAWTVIKLFLCVSVLIGHPSCLTTVIWRILFLENYKLVSSKTGHETGEGCKLPWALRLVFVIDTYVVLMSNIFYHCMTIWFTLDVWFLLIVFFGETLTSNNFPFENKYLSFDRLIICIIVKCIGTAALDVYSVLIIATYLVGWKYEHRYDPIRFEWYISLVPLYWYIYIAASRPMS